MQARGSTTRATSVAKVAGQRGVKVLVIPGEEGIAGHWICSLIEERFEIDDSALIEARANQ